MVTEAVSSILDGILKLSNTLVCCFFFFCRFYNLVFEFFFFFFISFLHSGLGKGWGRFILLSVNDKADNLVIFHKTPIVRQRTLKGPCNCYLAAPGAMDTD